MQQEVLDGLRQRQGGHAAQSAFAHRSADPDAAQMRQPAREFCQGGAKEKTAAAACKNGPNLPRVASLEVQLPFNRAFQNGSSEFGGAAGSPSHLDAELIAPQTKTRNQFLLLRRVCRPADGRLRSV